MFMRWYYNVRNHGWDPLKNVINSFLKFFANANRQTQATHPHPLPGRLIVRNGRPN